MALLNFPASPAPGATYVQNSVTYQYNAAGYWEAKSTSGDSGYEIPGWAVSGHEPMITTNGVFEADIPAANISVPVPWAEYVGNGIKIVMPQQARTVWAYMEDNKDQGLISVSDGAAGYRPVIIWTNNVRIESTGLPGVGQTRLYMYGADQIHGNNSASVGAVILGLGEARVLTGWSFKEHEDGYTLGYGTSIIGTNLEDVTGCTFSLGYKQNFQVLNAKLNAASVNKILIDIQNYDKNRKNTPRATGLINLSGGTSAGKADLTAEGNAALAYLSSRATVTLNP